MVPRTRALLLALTVLVGAAVAGMNGPAQAGSLDNPEVEDGEGDVVELEVVPEDPEDPLRLVLGTGAMDLRRAWVHDGGQRFVLLINATSFRDRHFNGAMAEDAGYVFHFTHRGSRYQAMFHFDRFCLYDNTLEALPDDVPDAVPRDVSGCAQVRSQAAVYDASGFTFTKLCRNGAEVVGQQPGFVVPSASGEEPSINLTWQRLAPGQPFGEKLSVGESITDIVVETRKFPFNDEAQPPAVPDDTHAQWYKGFTCPVGGTVMDRMPDEGSGFCIVVLQDCDPPRPGRIIADHDLRLERPTEPLTVQQAVDHDRETSIEVIVENTGNVNDTVSLSIDGSSGWRVDLEPEEVTLGTPGSGNESARVQLTFSPPDHALPAAPPPEGVHRPPAFGVFRFRADSSGEDLETGDHVVLETDFVVRVVERVLEPDAVPVDVRVDAADREAGPGMPTLFHLEVENTEAKALPVSIDVEGGAPGWTAEVTPRMHTPLSPGESLTFTVAVSPPADATVGDAATFTVRATPGEGQPSEVQLNATVGSGEGVAGASLDDQYAQALQAAGLGVLAEAGLFGLLLLILLIVILLLLLFGRGRKEEVVEVQEVDEADETADASADRASDADAPASASEGSSRASEG